MSKPDRYLYVCSINRTVNTSSYMIKYDQEHAVFICLMFKGNRKLVSNESLSLKIHWAQGRLKRKPDPTTLKFMPLALPLVLNISFQGLGVWFPAQYTIVYILIYLLSFNNGNTTYRWCVHLPDRTCADLRLLYVIFDVLITCRFYNWLVDWWSPIPHIRSCPCNIPCKVSPI